MAREFIELPTLGTDGRLYHDQRLDTVEALIPNVPFNSCHAADLLELSNGDLLCVWFAGSSEGYADISIVGSRLKAGESQWSNPEKISDDAVRSEQNPSLFQHPNGDIWLMYTAQVARTKDTPALYSLQFTAEIRCKISSDQGYTWGETTTMFDYPGSFCRQKIQVLSNGRWIFGNWRCFEDKTRNGSDITLLQLSDDEGKTWRAVEMPGSAGRVHANVIELEGGNLIALLRSRFSDRIYISTSSDFGDEWTIPYRTELRNNNSSISAVKLQSGGIAMIYNDVSFSEEPSGKVAIWPDQRCPVTLAISDDGGKTWPYRRIVEIGEGFTGPWNDVNNRRYEYPVVMQGADGKVHAAYSWGGRKQVKYVAVSEEWIRGDRTIKGAEDDPLYPCNR
ncbi:MAG: exo-alpha-sialidase [Clostridiales bacterium]|nr:exo-alpha-sialidase [Clostridiales bacterium]